MTCHRHIIKCQNLCERLTCLITQLLPRSVYIKILAKFIRDAIVQIIDVHIGVALPFNRHFYIGTRTNLHPATTILHDVVKICQLPCVICVIDNQTI
jgi:hypothetical protein